ncbi:MAG: hypothetical protein JST49_00320 [Bacteroidetes bacterium]|jgi:hypothetical protein|nr:hypothetical protein [Bacteroidota bacterium]
MLKRLWKYYGWIGTATTIYNKVLKPFYQELKKDAEELEKENKKKRQTRAKNAIDKKPKRSHKRQANTKGL